MRKVKDAGTRKTKIKVSGLARLCDVEWINRIKPDYAAFIFFDSYYRVGMDQAEHLRKKLAPEIQTVGSFSCLSFLLADRGASGKRYDRRGLIYTGTAHRKRWNSFAV